MLVISGGIAPLVSSWSACTPAITPRFPMTKGSPVVLRVNRYPQRVHDSSATRAGHGTSTGLASSLASTSATPTCRVRA